MKSTLFFVKITRNAETYSNVLLFNAVLSLHNVLPKDLQDMRFVDCDILKPHYISHIMKYASFSAVETLACNSQRIIDGLGLIRLFF